MKIFIPDNFLAERKYVIDTILDNFLGLEYQVFHEKRDNYKLLLNSGYEILINDDFWQNFDEDNGYLDEKNIPEKVTFAENSFTVEKNIPVIFGNEQIKIEKNKIFCGIDIFASAFFMLSRWEEYVITEKDKHNRFICTNSLAFKNNFQHRPVVNELTEFLYNLLKKAGCTQQKKLHSFEVIPTHDIDYIEKYSTAFSGIKVTAAELLKHKNPINAFRKIKEWYNVKKEKIADPFNTFDELMTISEKNNVKSHFYFIAGQKGEQDYRYDFFSTKTQNAIKKIKERGHIIGIHGSYSSYNNQEQFLKEVKRFREINIDISESRQHYLRFSNPQTWQILEKAEIDIDSTIGYSIGSGFRAGVCYEYNPFDILQRKKLKIKERPLIFMETTSRTLYENIDEFINHIKELKNNTKKFNGNFVFLWHNSNFNNDWSENLFNLYQLLIK